MGNVTRKIPPKKEGEKAKFVNVGKWDYNQETGKIEVDIHLLDKVYIEEVQGRSFRGILRDKALNIVGFLYVNDKYNSKTFKLLLFDDLFYLFDENKNSNSNNNNEFHF